MNPVALHFEEIKDRWGYCSRAGEVTLALDLVNTGERFQDYVIVHELLHLRVRSHGKRFRALLSAYVPDWRDLDEPDSAHGGCELRRPEAGKPRDASGERMPCADIAREDNSIHAEGVERGTHPRLKRRRARGAP